MNQKPWLKSIPGWNEAKIAHHLYHDVFDRKHAIVIPNSYFTGFETDLLVVRNDLRLMDIEIKSSRSDLKNDRHKDKWRGWKTYTMSPEDWPHVDWPNRIWKHYYCVPRAIWDDSLFERIKPQSGVLLMKDTGIITVKRQAKPNPEARVITMSECLSIARGCTVRMWKALLKDEVNVGAIREARNVIGNENGKFESTHERAP